VTQQHPFEHTVRPDKIQHEDRWTW